MTILKQLLKLGHHPTNKGKTMNQTEHENRLISEILERPAKAKKPTDSEIVRANPVINFPKKLVTWLVGLVKSGKILSFTEIARSEGIEIAQLIYNGHLEFYNRYPERFDVA